MFSLNKKTEGPQEQLILSPTTTQEADNVVESPARPQEVVVTSHPSTQEGSQQVAEVGSGVDSSLNVEDIREQVESLQLGGDQRSVAWHEVAELSGQNVFGPTHGVLGEHARQAGVVAANGVEQVQTGK